MNSKKPGFEHKIETSSLLTVIGILLLFSGAVIVTLISPRFIDSAWIEPSSYYQRQMYEIADPNIYVGGTVKGTSDLQFVYHLKNEETLLGFIESDNMRIIAPAELEEYITHPHDQKIKLTSRLLLLRKPEIDFHISDEKFREQLLEDTKVGLKKIYTIFELYEPNTQEALAIAETDGIFESFADSDYLILDNEKKLPYHQDPGVIYVKNPQEYRVKQVNRGGRTGWNYDPNGEKVNNLAQLTSPPLSFRSRKELIAQGEDIIAKEGCWYCHTFQTRTLVQDVVLNGSESYPAPPSSPNEYIYQKVTFPGTRRIGPDLSRVGIKRPSRDWHKSHFKSPKTESKGSLMPSFNYFFDDDPRGTKKNSTSIPHYQFEAVFQYLMTNGTRITPPTQGWWLGKDPVDTLGIIEGR